MFDCIYMFFFVLIEWRLSFDSEYINRFKNGLNKFKEKEFIINY